MRVNFFLALMAVAMSCVLGYLFYNVCGSHENAMLCGIVTTVTMIATLVPMMAIKVESSRVSVNLRILSSIGFFILFGLNLGYAIFGIVVSYYLIVNALCLIIFIIGYYNLLNIKNI